MNSNKIGQWTGNWTNKLLKSRNQFPLTMWSEKKSNRTQTLWIRFPAQKRALKFVFKSFSTDLSASQAEMGLGKHFTIKYFDPFSNVGGKRLSFYVVLAS